MLQRLKINGFKSIKNMDLELRPLNILIGANGAGKSNLISFFKMLNEMMSDRLQQYIGISGYAHSLLHFGPKVTPQIEGELEFEFGDATYKYHFSLRHAAGDTLIFGEENLSAKGLENNSRLLLLRDSLGSGHQESKMIDGVAEGLQTAIPLNYLLSQFRVYHFHDTSSTSAIRQSCYVGYNKLLMSDGGNVAALLLRLREDNNIVYQRIIKTIRLIAPFFDDFVLEPRGNNVILNWREKGSDQVFGPHQFSDGTLRAICLITFSAGYQYLLAKDKNVIKQIANGELFSRDPQTLVTTRLSTDDYGGLFNRSRNMWNIKLFYENLKHNFSANIRGIYRGKYGLGDRNGNLILDQDYEYVQGFMTWNMAVSKEFFNKNHFT
ncbi:MAG: DUF2813 domain-containing protein, partial [Nostocales cyanobacterium]